MCIRDRVESGTYLAHDGGRWRFEKAQGIIVGTEQSLHAFQQLGMFAARFLQVRRSLLSGSAEERLGKNLVGGGRGCGHREISARDSARTRAGLPQAKVRFFQ